MRLILPLVVFYFSWMHLRRSIPSHSRVANSLKLNWIIPCERRSYWRLCMPFVRGDHIYLITLSQLRLIIVRYRSCWLKGRALNVLRDGCMSWASIVPSFSGSRVRLMLWPMVSHVALTFFLHRVRRPVLISENFFNQLWRLSMNPSSPTLRNRSLRYFPIMIRRWYYVIQWRTLLLTPSVVRHILWIRSLLAYGSFVSREGRMLSLSGMIHKASTFVTIYCGWKNLEWIDYAFLTMRTWDDRFSLASTMIHPEDIREHLRPTNFLNESISGLKCRQRWINTSERARSANETSTGK